MAYKQTRNFNQNAAARVGLCLQYVQNGFSSGWAGPDAWTAWTKHVKHRHGNRNFPKNVVIPVWFSGTWEGNYYGHVAALDTRTGRVYTSPYYKSTGYEWYASIDDLIRTFRGAMPDITYRGWSEDIGGVRVVEKAKMQGGNMAIVQNQENWYQRCNDTHWRIRGRALTRASFGNFVGRDFLHFVETCSDDPEAQRVQQWQELGKKATQDNWQGQIHTLQERVKSLGSRPTKEQLQAAQSAVKKLEGDMQIAQAEATQARRDAAEANKKLEALEGETQQAEKEASNFLTAVINAIRKIFGGKS